MSAGSSKNLPSVIDIEFDGVNPTNNGWVQIKKIFDYLKKDPNHAISLVGAATPQGSPLNNKKLAINRADQVKKILEKMLKEAKIDGDEKIIIKKTNLQAKKSSVEVGTKIDMRSADGKAAISFFYDGSFTNSMRTQIQGWLNHISTAEHPTQGDLSPAERRKMLDNMAQHLQNKGFQRVRYGGYDNNINNLQLKQLRGKNPAVREAMPQPPEIKISMM